MIDTDTFKASLIAISGNVTIATTGIASTISRASRWKPTYTWTVSLYMADWNWWHVGVRSRVSLMLPCQTGEPYLHCTRSTAWTEQSWARYIRSIDVRVVCNYNRAFQVLGKIQRSVQLLEKELIKWSHKQRKCVFAKARNRIKFGTTPFIPRILDRAMRNAFYR